MPSAWLTRSWAFVVFEGVAWLRGVFECLFFRCSLGGLVLLAPLVSGFCHAGVGSVMGDLLAKEVFIVEEVQDAPHQREADLEAYFFCFGGAQGALKPSPYALHNTAEAPFTLRPEAPPRS